MEDERVLADRGKALEEEFFRKQNQELAARLKQKQAKQEAKHAIEEVSGISDDRVLEKLVDFGIGAETVTAMTLIPLVEVAWADGDVDDKEREAILQGAADSGVGPDSAPYALLQSWLNDRPSPRLLGVWREYVGALCEPMLPEQRQKLKEEVLGRAQAVAEAAGGILGLGNRISKREQEVFGILETAFKL